MPTTQDYTKVNATHESNRALKILAAERGKAVYEVLDDILREKFPNYFRGC